MTPLTILLVDDSETDRATYRRFLQRSALIDCQLVELDQGEAALEWCKHQFPDLILLDYQLPDLDGLEFLSALQVQTGKTEFPLIVLTAYGNVEVAVEAMKRGAQDYLDKSRCTAEELQSRIHGVLERSHLKQSLAWQQERQHLVATTALRIRQSLALHNILQTAVEEVRALLDSDRVLLYQFEADWSGTVVMESVVAGYPAILGDVIHDPCIEYQWAESYQEGRYTSHTNILTEGLADCYAELMQRFQVQANLVVPILQTGQLWGLLIVHQCRSPRQWQDREIEFLQELAVQLAIALSQAEFQTQLQQELLQRQQAEIELRDREQLFSTLAKTLPVVIFRFDRNSHCVYINNYWTTLTGRSIDSVAGLGWVETLHPQDRDRLTHEWLEWSQNPQQRKIYQNEGRLLHASGQEVWYYIQALPEVSPTGEITGYLGVFTDITERKQSEADLQHSEARLSLAQTASNSAVWDWDIPNNSLFWSPEYYNLYGIDPSLEPSYENWIRCIHPDDQARTGQQTLQALEDPSSELRVEFRVILADEVRWFLGIGRVLRDEAGAPLRMIGITLDITHQKQIEIALQELNAELEQRVIERTTELTALNNRLLTAYQEQARVQEALQVSEERRRLALDLTHIGTWDYQISGGKPIWNDNHFTLLGLTPGSCEPTYELWSSHIHPDDAAWVLSQFSDCLKNRTDYAAEYRIIRADRSVRWLMGRGKAIYDEAGEAVRSLGVLLDITDQKLAELALQQQTKLEQLRWSITQAIRESLDLSAILETTVQQVQLTLRCDRTAVYQFQPDWSGNFVAESVGDGWIQLVGSDVQKVHQDTYLQRTAGGRFKNHEVFVVPDIYTMGLEPCHVELLEQFQAKAYAVVPVFAGEQLWGLLAVYQNAQPRQWQTWEIKLLQQVASQLSIALQQSNLYNQLQIELRERMQAVAEIEEAERRWRSLVENVQLIVVELNRRGQVTYVNPFFLKLTGYFNSEVLGQNWFERFIPLSQQTTIQIDFAQVLAHEAPPYYRNSILTKAGEELMIAWTNTVRQDSNGQSIGSISIGEDITERHKVEKMKSEFLSIVSHELRTPLTSISGALELISTGLLPFDSERCQQSLQIAASEADRLTRLVNDILDLERLESGKVQLSLHPYNLSSLMQRAIVSLELLAAQHQITLSGTPLSVMVNVDSDRILQVLTNLLSNAIKFSEPQTTIWLTAQWVTDTETTCDFVCVTVRDQGRGIPNHKLETIFDRFQQVDASDSRKKGGTGLGLAICQNIIQQHGGRIWADSVLGQGSQFHFTLPLQIS